MTPFIQLDKKHPELVSLKVLSILFKEATSFINEQDNEKQKIAAFYQSHEATGEIMAFGAGELE